MILQPFKVGPRKWPILRILQRVPPLHSSINDFYIRVVIVVVGYSLCKIVSLGQKLKMPKTCEKRFYKNIRIFFVEKTAQKNTKYARNETILKVGHLAKAIAFAK